MRSSRLKSLAVSAVLCSMAMGTAHAGLLSFWDFNEVSGTTAHDSAGSVNGTLQGSAAFVGGGEQGGAVSISGIGGGLVKMGNNFAFDNSSAYTLQTWVKLAPGETGGYIPVSQHFATHVQGYALAIGNIGDGCGGAAGSTHLYSEYPCSPNSTLAVNDGNWHQIVGTFQGGVASIYVDGQFQGSSSGTTLNQLTGKPFIVGGLSDPGGNPVNDFNGLIDNVAVWDNALSAAQVQNLFNNGGDPTVPEPASIGLALAGSALLLAYRRRATR